MSFKDGNDSGNEITLKEKESGEIRIELSNVEIQVWGTG